MRIALPEAGSRMPCPLTLVHEAINCRWLVVDQIVTADFFFCQPLQRARKVDFRVMQDNELYSAILAHRVIARVDCRLSGTPHHCRHHKPEREASGKLLPVGAHRHGTSPKHLLGFLSHSANIRAVKITREFITRSMSHNSSLISAVSRFTLKLKPGVRKSPREIKTAPPPRPPSKLSQKPGAAWSDDLKRYY
jgi:hypothetical protein